MCIRNCLHKAILGTRRCGSKNTTKIENRTRANQVLENLFYYFYCETCRKSANEFCKKLDDKQTKIVWMRLCFKYQLWEELNKDEMNFLKAIYYLKTWNRIYHKIIKLDLNYSFKILFKLDTLLLPSINFQLNRAETSVSNLSRTATKSYTNTVRI
jgi:hypothetical protein